MHIHYLLQVHQHPEQFGRLIRRLAAPFAHFYVHVDLKSDIQPFLRQAEGVNNVHFFDEERLEVRWGDISQVHATLLGVNKLVAEKKEGYAILMSGADYPIKSNVYIQRFFQVHNGVNFIACKDAYDVWGHCTVGRLESYNFHPFTKRRHTFGVSTLFGKNFWTLMNVRNTLIMLLLGKFGAVRKALANTRTFPSYLQAFGGSQWWALPMSSLYMIHDFMQAHPDYLAYHEHTHVPDEIFFHSMIGSLVKAEKIKPSITYVDWRRKGVPLPVVFQAEDLEILANCACLFARKLAPESSGELMDLIDQKLLHREEQMQPLEKLPIH